MAENLEPTLMNLPSVFSRSAGKERRRSVWPFGAVSNTMHENSMFCTSLRST
jgi:hypothetical protein